MKFNIGYVFFVLFMQFDGLSLGTEYNLVVFLHDSPDPADKPYSLQKVMPAIDIAIEKVNNDTSVLPGSTLKAITVDSSCDRKESVIAALEVSESTDISCFVGPACWHPMELIGVMAVHWNIPIISGASEDQDLNDKSIYSTLTRTYPPLDRLAIAFYHMIESFDFSLFGMIYDMDTQETLIVAIAVYTTIEDKTNSSFTKDIRGVRGFHPHDIDDEELLAVLRNVSLVSRVIVICAIPVQVRRIMLLAYDLGLINGEYLFFDVQTSQELNEEIYPWKRGDDRDEDAKIAYQALMTVTNMRPDSEEYMQFSAEVRERAFQNYNFSYTEDVVNNFVGAFHDAVLLYALALNDTLLAGNDPKDGYNLTRTMWNRTFKGITGNVSMDSYGDRNGDYSILDMTNPETGMFKPVLNYYGDSDFVDFITDIHWPGGATGPPDDIPECGFFNENCPEEKNFPISAIIGLVIGIMLVSCIVIAAVLYRKYRLESELVSMTWKIKWEDITFAHIKKSRIISMNIMNKSLPCNGKNNETMSNLSSAEMGNQIFTNVGHYKGNLVAVKKLNSEKIELTRGILIELKQRKDIEHNHIVRFVGACVEMPNIAIITEYCPKGSLQDVLENDSIQLDWMFRYSMMNDIINGLHFLHHSIIKYHGNLTSSNCVVDSRFVLKLTDFGLNSLSRGKARRYKNDYNEMSKMLWKAPEILRESSSRGSQEGDIYSFGIIVYAITTRAVPFEAESVDIHMNEIVEKIKKVESPPFRPGINNEICPAEVRRLIQACWRETPHDRPNIGSVRSDIRKINSNNSHGGNIMDNLLNRMEQYANNLESLVEQRTEAFLEEKRKSEQLLYSILPNSVAKQLIRGEIVEPECFESVTIFFSDIVGFTSLCATSGPLEVVNMLNDLYTCFDALINNFDVYKVETIGDAYMVVSGLPIRNGNKHAREIARMSLALLKAVSTFKVRHKPDHQLKLRVGMHTGSCVAGVVGLKMPRYCLFGDTVNTASRMESNGEAFKIHVSSSTWYILNTFLTFRMERRGEIEMKGKGKQTTYWLIGEEHEDDENKNGDPS
ncbi:atrial natriuretic peptide receptor 1-like [Glandiceps talaboti]